MNQPPLGSGPRFAALKNNLSNKPGVTDPDALAASIGRAKLGNSKMSALAQHGKMRAQLKGK